MIKAFAVPPRFTGLAVLGICLACGTSGVQAGVETVRAGGVLWLSGGASTAGTSQGLGRANLQPSSGALYKRPNTRPINDASMAAGAASGTSELAVAQPHDAAGEAPAVPFIGLPGSLVAFRRGATPGLGDRPRSLSDMAPVLPVVEQAAEDNRLDPALLLAVIHAESGFNPQALSPKGAIGLMQLMPTTASRYGNGDLRDPRRNVQAGAAHLRYLLGRYGDISLALAAYNAGEGAVERHGMRIPPYAETQDYVPRVLSLYRRYQQRDEASPSHERAARKVRTEWLTAPHPGASDAPPAARNLRTYAASLH
ncbi:lytic transglycosylase domain-containing protein [Ralstonia soli]|uniref:Lytic transglycosylase domain-containing protein n=1 Tax=Ralstonia soli TaxID=2953896 RepID=A0ABT1AFG5_9RALS|nr:lytic transglycosylase domain-containing protein [Ralstonia soli]MCO5396857.1 lytic transglycosylase domain-containing protein [Ralstonia soli]